MKYSFGKILTIFTTHQRRTPITFYKDCTILVYDILNLLAELWERWLSLARMLEGNHSQLFHFLNTCISNLPRHSLLETHPSILRFVTWNLLPRRVKRKRHIPSI